MKVFSWTAIFALMTVGITPPTWAQSADPAAPQWQEVPATTRGPSFDITPSDTGAPQWQEVTPTGPVSIPSPPSSSPVFVETPDAPEQHADEPTPPTVADDPAQPLPPVAVSDPQYTIPPLMRPPIRLYNLETANLLPPGMLQLSGGLTTFRSDEVSGGGTGLQIFYGTLDFGLNEDMQISLTGNYFDDPLGRLVNGLQPDLQFGSVGASLKYRVHTSENLAIAISGGVEMLRVRSDNFMFSSSAEVQGSYTAAGSLEMPLTYTVTPQLQWHFTPAVAFLPENVNRADFYGTNISFGTGLSWQPHERLNFFTDVTMPVGPGGNTVRGSDGAIVNFPVWSAGVRLLVNPAVSMDLAATNSFGVTPATRTLAFLPDGNHVALRAGLTYTPDMGLDYAPSFLPSFRSGPRQPLDQRDRQLLLDGITIPTADTLLPGMLRVRGSAGQVGQGVNIALGVVHDAQFEIAVEQLEPGVDLIENVDYSGNLNFGLAAKLRFLDQVQGDPFSFALKGSFNRGFLQGAENFGSRSVAVIELPFTYRPIEPLALFINPKFGLLTGDTRVGGVGLGVNYEVVPGLQFIGEATPIVTGERSVFSLGMRYLIPQWNVGIDVYGSNAAGQNMAVGGLIGQNSPGVGVNIQWLFGGQR